MRNFIGVVFAAGILAPSVGAQGKLSGWYTETHVTSRREGQRAASPAPRDETIRSWRTATSERLEGGLPPFPQYDMTGAYQISRSAEKRTYQVVPSARTIRVFDMAAMTALKLDRPSYAKPVLKELGDGGVILGHRTRRYQMTITMRTPGIARRGDSTTFTSEQTFWIASDPSDPLVAAYLAERPKPTSPVTMPVLPGMVLRTGSRSSSISPYTTATVREVVAWRREVVEPSRFVLPADYKRVDMAAEVRATRAKTEAMRVAGDEMQRLFSSKDPKDRARAKQLAESLFKTMKPDSARLKEMMRKDPNAVRITDTTPARRNP
jgi:hypothetical protein